MAKTFSIDRILHGEEHTQDVESSDSQLSGVVQKPGIDYSQSDLDLMNQMAAAAYYPAASLLSWHSVQSQALPLWHQHGKQLPAQRYDLGSLAAVHHHQQAAAMLAPAQAGFPFGWIPAVNPSDLAFFHGASVPYFPMIAGQNPIESERLLESWHRHQLHPSLMGAGASADNVRAGLAPVTSVSRKGGQIRFDVRQSHQLEETFSTNKYLTPGQRRALANRLALTERQVKTWFQNRRAKWRRTRKEEKLHQDGKRPEKRDHHEAEETICDQSLSEDSEIDLSATPEEMVDRARKP